MKYCPSCRTKKNRLEFYKDLSRGDGLCGWCKKCRRIKSSIFAPDRIPTRLTLEEGRYRKRAASMLSHAVKGGFRPPCLVCGSTSRVEGHHEDYSKPLDVLWLCRHHHLDLHKIKRRCDVVDKNYVAGLRIILSRAHLVLEVSSFFV